MNKGENIMRINVNELDDRYNFFICGASYAGNPENNTMMYISKKVAYLLDNLNGHEECLVFLEKGIDVPLELKDRNCFVLSENPQLSYAKFANVFYQGQRKQEIQWGYTLTEGGYYIGHNVEIGHNAYIEPGCLIGHNVVIGDNATILSGAVIKYATIGDNFLCNENAVIGYYSFTMAEDSIGNKYRIPALGRVLIGDCVEIGANTTVEIGACGDTILEDYVKLDGLVLVGHEAHLHKNVEITAGTIIAGFVEIGKHSYLGLNSTLKNRIHLGSNVIVGMGSNVIKSVEEGTTVIGNPAKPLIKKYCE